MCENKLFMKQMTLKIILFSVLLLMLPLAASAKTIFVDHNNASGVEDGTSDNPFNTIQEGINDASLDDVVKVYTGVYNENLTINGVNIRLIGEDPQTTIISGTSTVITISGNFNTGSQNVEVSGFSITGGSNYGVYFNSLNVTGIIHNNIIFGNKNGIYATSSSNANIYNNVIVNNAAEGIGQVDRQYVVFTISNNIIVDNGTYGIIMRTFGTFLASYNNVFNNASGNIYGATVINNISQNPLFIEASSSDYRLASGSPSIDAGQSILSSNDPDGTRNDQGAYGGPGAVNFWPGSAGGPVVTELSVTPPSVVSGGTITIRATGKIR